MNTLKFTTSVILSTFNGERYLVEQLDSIRNQTGKIDEVIICDDCSTDNTCSIIEQYIHKYRLINWRLYKNKTNLGWKKNFKQGLDLCSGKYIFLCDQDDIWETDKVKKMVDIMEKNPNIDVLATNYTMFYSNTNQKSIYENNVKKMKDDDSIEYYRFNERWPYVARPGCTYCIKKSFYDSIVSLWIDDYPHDANLHRFAIINGGLAIYNKSLIKFRRHGNNASGKRNITKNDRLADIDYYIDFYNRYRNYAANGRGQDKVSIIDNGLEWLHLRHKCLDNKSILIWIKLMLFYRKHYATTKGLFADLLYIFK